MVPLSYNVRSLFVRKTTTAATALGIGLVVFVMASSMMLSAGIEETMSTAGHPDYAIVLRNGSTAELTSNIDQATVGLVGDAPGVARDDNGEPLAAGEVVTVIALDKLGTDGGVSNVSVRGVQGNIRQLRPDAHLVSGQWATPGTDECVVGKAVRGRFKGVALGGSFELKKNRPLKVVGVFEAGGSALESEVWADIDTVRTSFGRDGLVSSVTVKLESAAKFDGFSAAIEHDKQLGLDAMRESEYYEKSSEGTSLFMGILGTVIAITFSLGAMIGATITMYGAVAQRRREIGTLRALGFSRWSILGSFLIEAIVLALIGSVIGVVAALFMGFVKFSMINMATWSEVVFSFHPTFEILVKSMIFGAVMGVFGGFLPAWRAAKTPPVAAMRG